MILASNVTIDTIIHELVHAGTSYGLVATEKKDGVNLRDGVFKPFLKYITDYIKNTTGADVGPHELRGYTLPADIYAFTNPAEFIAELFSNKKFQELLDTIPPRSEKEHRSALQEFISIALDFINKLFGRNQIKPTALTQAKELAYGVIATQQEAIDDVYGLILGEHKMRKKRTPKHNKNDVSAFHLDREYNEVSNDIFKIPSERKYKKEIQAFVEKLPADTDRSRGIHYLSKDGKRVFRINTSVENFNENKQETTYGFEVVDWYNLEKLSAEKQKEIGDGYKEKGMVLNSLLTQYEREEGSRLYSNGLLSDREANRGYDGLDQGTSSGESYRGRDNRNSRGNNVQSEVTQQFKTSDGEIYGFVDADGNVYFDEEVISAEHPIHEYTHIWDRMVAAKNPTLWKRGVELMKKTKLWDEIANSEEYGQEWKDAGFPEDKFEF